MSLTFGLTLISFFCWEETHVDRFVGWDFSFGVVSTNKNHQVQIIYHHESTPISNIHLNMSKHFPTS